jgi:hypothetical protein
VYRQLTPNAPTTAALTLPISLIVGLVLTVAVWDVFGVLGVVIGWMLMVIPAVSYLLGLPVAFVLARLEGSVRRPTSPAPATLDLRVRPRRQSNIGSFKS